MKKKVGRPLIPDKELLLANSIPEPNSGCWLWTRSLSNWGYGHLGSKRRDRGAHRLSYLTFIGPIPPGMHVLHRCDIRSCINPDHLFLGTRRDNLRDAVAKGRGNFSHGERNFKAKLTWDDVDIIRRSTLDRDYLAIKFEVRRETIYCIQTRRTWKTRSIIQIHGLK